MPMGEGGTSPPVGYDLMSDVGIEGPLVDQRGPHYFDVRAEAVYLERDVTFGPNVNFSQDGLAGDIVLFSDQLQYDAEPGFRILGRYDIGPLSVLEFGYMGIYSFADEAVAFPTVANRLFSLFSLETDPTQMGFGRFGFDPDQVSDVNGPMRETERASQHSISLESDLQTAEITYRRYWVGWIPRVSGTLLAGFRYTKLSEEFEFNSIGSTAEAPASLSYLVDADNDLAGFQTGGDIWIGLSQGLRVGAEGKVGLYANHYTLITDVSTDPSPSPPTTVGQPTPDPTLFEESREDQPAFIGELSVDLVADILPSWSLRVGYEILFIESLVLAGENFNTGSPFNPGPVDNGFGPLRTPFLRDQSDVFYHGGHAGIEFIW
jgi:hypothetical protein